MKYFISFLIFILITGLVFFYFQISKPEKIYLNVEKKESNISKINVFEIKKPKLINLPVRVLYMKIDFQKYKYKIIYKITISNVDKFAIFNIKTILDNYKILYSMIRAKKTEIYIFFKSLDQANSVLNLFKEYNFKIKIEKLVKRI